MTLHRSSEKTPLIVATLLIMLMAALLRFPSIGGQSLWVDEVVSLNLSAWPLGTILTVEDGLPPLYPLIMKAVRPLLASDLCGRIVSAVFGVASVGLILWLGTKLYNLQTGIFAAILLALSPMHVWYSREGRMYAMLAFWALLSSLFIENLTEKGRWGARGAYCSATLGGIFTHYAYVGVVLAQGLFVLPKIRIREVTPRSIFLGFFALTIISIAVFPLVKEAITYGPLGPVREFQPFSLPYTAFTFVAGFGIGPSLEELHRNTSIQTVLPYWPEVALVVITGAVMGLSGLRALSKSGGTSLYILLWLVVPPLIAFFVSWASGIAYNVRYVITSLPAFLLVIALGLERHGRVFALTALGALIVISALSIARGRLDPRYAREDLRATARYLESKVEQDHRIIVSANSVSVALKHYYNGPQAIEALPIRPVRTGRDAVRVMRTLSETRHTTWLVLSRDWEGDPRDFLKKELAKSDSAELAARFPGVKVYEVRASFD